MAILVFFFFCFTTYSGNSRSPALDPRVLDFCGALLTLAWFVPFHSVLINLYRDGDDRMGWPCDDEPELDPSAPIASLSLGQPSFRFKPKGRGPDSR